MTDKPTPIDAELFALIKEHFGLDQRRDDTVINRSTGRFHDAQRYRDFAAAMARLAKWGQPAQAAEPVAWLDPWTGTKVTTDYDAYGKHGIPLYTAPQPVAREQLTPERVKEIARGAGYYQCGIPDTERSAFINGLRHGEREHGIKRGQHG